jgi:hypothetical protein
MIKAGIAGLLLIATPTFAAQPARSSAATPAPAAKPAAAPQSPLAEAKPDAHGIKRMAVLRALDKITGRTTDINAPAGVPVRYGSLIITAQYCYTVPPEQPPDTTAFLQIDESKRGQQVQRLFSGWMFASTPALNALEHPTYDVWVITCKTEEPVKAAAVPPPKAVPAAPARSAAPPAAPVKE